jgi:putative ABC transport system permease protein
VNRSRLRLVDVGSTATLGLRARPWRSLLSALGIGVGVAAIVAVLGIAQSSRAELLAQIDQLGTNLLVVANGHAMGGDEVELPATATAQIGRVDGVRAVAPTAELINRYVYRTDRIPAAQNGGLAVRAADPRLLSTLDGAVSRGRYLDGALERYPTTVLGAQAAAQLGIGQLDQATRVWLGGHWFTVVGVLRPLPLAPEIDRSALIGFGIAGELFGYDGRPSRIYLRTDVSRVDAVHALLPATVAPASPSEVAVSRPSDALTVRASAAGTLDALLLGLGLVALLVGAIGIANVMVIAVLERRGEIGLRRAMGAARIHVAVQFVVESLALALVGAAGGLIAGVAVTVLVARVHGWAVWLPVQVPLLGTLAAVTTGVLAGLYPALRAARLSPTDALRAG